jgi:2-polyprenyl-3-methyl-5-hydroxy-6-metoxy-1,4-benzoquinol methylase
MSKSLLADVIQWDVRNWSEALRYWERNVDWNRVENCLELGAKEGGLSLWMALKGKSVVCSDVDDTQARARARHAKYDLENPIEYAVIDAADIPFENHFDIIAFKSMLGAIGAGGHKERQQAAIDQMHKALKPGGKLLFAENMAASPLHRMVRKKFVSWVDCWRYVTAEEMKQFLHRFARSRVCTTGVLGTFGRTERQRNILAVFDQTLLNPLTPREWHYLVFGVAEK